MGRALAVAHPLEGEPSNTSAPRALRIALVSKAMIGPDYRLKAELVGRAEDLEVTLVVPREWRAGRRRLVADERPGAHYDVRAVPARRPGDFHLHWFPTLGSVLREWPADLVHLDDEPYNLATLHGLRTARRQGARGLFFAWQNLERRVPPPFNLIQRWVFRLADGAIAGSRRASDVLRGRGYRGPIWIVPQFGVDHERFTPGDGHGTGSDAHAPDPRALASGRRGATNARAHSAAEAHELVVGYAGRLVAAKGVDTLLDALAGLGRPFRLEVAGEGPAAEELMERAAGLGIGDRVHRHGWLAPADLPAFYRALDVFVLPSRTTARWAEQFGRVLIEAMACGVPCVGSDSGEIPHVLGAAGRVVPEGDPAALARALRDLADDPEARRALGMQGRARVMERYTMASVAAATADVYRQVCRTRAADKADAVRRSSATGPSGARL